MPDTLAAITAAGITYRRSDFADPQLDGPTALTVTSDGRVYGHLATKGTCHIGYGDRCVTPPMSKSDYKYFHQGVVATEDGDLPVGKLTIGTGHASLGQNAVAAAAHYDNTGSTVATVRAGEDEHGIWLAGRLVPGTPPERVDELRRSGVSGDWRGIDGNMELVAALAVNVPGFPVPRTEELVAAGGVASLVAAGVVAPGQEEPLSGEDLESMITAAAAKVVEERFVQQRRRDAVVSRVEPIVASAGVDRRKRAAAEVERVQAARAADDIEALTAAVDSGIPGHLPRDLKNYWTKGAGLARWAPSPHPYTALTRALRSELPAKAQHMVNGLAANLFKAVFGIYPGQRKELTAAGSGRRVRTQEGADRFGVGVGDLIPKAVAQAQQTAGDFAEAAGNDVAKLIDPDRDETNGPTSADGEEASDEDQASTDAGVETAEPTLTEDTDPEAVTDAPIIPDDAPAPRMDVGAGTDHPLEEDESPETGALGGKLLSFDDGKAYYDDGSWTDGTEWHVGDPAVPEEERGYTDVPTSEAAEQDTASDFDASDPAANPEGFADSPEPGTEVADTDIPVRTDGTGYLEEDQIPETGAHGGQLVDYSDGIAFYDDGTDTDGTAWRYSEPVEEPDDPEAIAASANRHARIMRRLGYRAGNRRAAYPKA